MPSGLTILIVARNAEATIERAVRSSLAEEACAVVLVDDHSADGTVARARAIGGRLTICQAPDPGGVSLARQAALDAVTTEYAASLDADDEWLPGRATRLEQILRSGSDVAVESIDLHDGPSGARLRTLTCPSFLRRPGAAVRLFERNVLPGDTQLAFRTSTFRDAGGYDPSITGPESFDILLRAISRGARVGFGDAIGYRMHAYPGSLSRNLSRQRASLAMALRKHTYDDVRRLYTVAGYDERITAWGLVLMAQFRDEPTEALRWLDVASPERADPDEVLEPAGPWPFAEGWRRAFHRGTILLTLAGRDEEAADELGRAEMLSPTPEGLNNLGIASARLGRSQEARAAFAAALERSAGYRDASVNLAAEGPTCITTHPLRHTASRTDYSTAA